MIRLIHWTAFGTMIVMLFLEQSAWGSMVGMNETRVIARDISVYSQPHATKGSSRLSAGQKVQVIGRDQDSGWLFLRCSGRMIGYVPPKAFKQPDAHKSARQPKMTTNQTTPRKPKPSVQNNVEKIAQKSTHAGDRQKKSKKLLNDKDSCKGIVTAAWEGNYDKVNSLLKKGVDPNCIYYGKSPLLAAARFGRSYSWDKNIDVVKLLVKSGADISYEQTAGHGITSTYIAARAGHTNTAIYLVSQGGSAEEANKGIREYAAQENGSLAALALVAKAAKSYAQFLATSATHSNSSSGSGAPDYVMVHADPGFVSDIKLTLSGGSGNFSSNGGGSIVSILKGYNGSTAGTYRYLVQWNRNKSCSGSFTVSGTKGNVFINLHENCDATITEH